jgi:Mrp family chromosome partitioning ATPase
MVGFFASLRALHDCDFVIVDTPPVLAVADASVMAPQVDSVLLVLDASNTTRTELAQTKAQLDNAGATMLGCVYNNFDVNRTYPGEYYTYGYYERSTRQGYVDANGSASHGRLPWSRSRRNGSDAGLELKDVYDARPPGPGQ